MKQDSYGSQAVEPNAEARQTFEGFQDILSTVLPATLRFQRIRIRVPDVILETATGDFAFDAVSSGVSALIDLAWQVYLYSLLHDRFVVVIDEPEAHLHPELQRLILPSLLAAFPQAQFVVASHNPFVVGSVADSNVYVLRYNDSRKVESILLDQVNKAGTADEILREVLGLTSTSAIWVAKRLEAIVNKYSTHTLNEKTLSDLRTELKELGLDKYVPTTIVDVIDRQEDAK